jgi:ribosomal protein S27AE
MTAAKSPKNPIICPRCGVPMNHHAEKLVYETGRIEEMHSCPSCGLTLARPADDSQAETVARERR